MDNKPSAKNKPTLSPALDASADPTEPSLGAPPVDVAALQAELAATQKRNRELEAALVTNAADTAALQEDDIAIPGDRPKVGPIHPQTNRPVFNSMRPTGKG